MHRWECLGECVPEQLSSVGPYLTLRASCVVSCVHTRQFSGDMSSATPAYGVGDNVDSEGILMAVVWPPRVHWWARLCVCVPKQLLLSCVVLCVHTRRFPAALMLRLPCLHVFAPRCRPT